MAFAGWNFWEMCLKGAETQLVYVGSVFGFCLLSTALPPFSYLELGLNVWGWSSRHVTMRWNATREEGGSCDSNGVGLLRTSTSLGISCSQEKQSKVQLGHVSWGFVRTLNSSPREARGFKLGIRGHCNKKGQAASPSQWPPTQGGLGCPP